MGRGVGGKKRLQGLVYEFSPRRFFSEATYLHRHSAPLHIVKGYDKMARTLIQRLWGNVTELKVLLDGNPHIVVQDCKTLLGEMELKVKRLRLREIKKAQSCDSK
jgi:hypothetical protein